MTHAELVEKAGAWLRRQGCAVVVTELVSGPETADALGWRGTLSTLIECKATRADFLRDRKKFFRQHQEQGMGHERYYLAPRGLIEPDELPTRWGLLVVGDTGKVRKAVTSAVQPSCERHEISILLSCIRRIGNGFDAPCSVRAYTYETKSTATLGVARG